MASKPKTQTATRVVLPKGNTKEENVKTGKGPNKLKHATPIINATGDVVEKQSKRSSTSSSKHKLDTSSNPIQSKPLAQTKVSEKRQPKPISQLTPSTKLLDSGDGVKNKQTRPPSRSEKDINIKSNHSTPPKAVTDDAIDKGRKQQASSTSKQPNLGPSPIQSSPSVQSEFSNKPHTKSKLKSGIQPVDTEGCIKKQNNRQPSASKQTSNFSKSSLVLNEQMPPTQVPYTRKTILKPSPPNAALNITEDDVKRSTRQQQSSIKKSTPDFSSYSSLTDSLVETQASHKRSTKAKSSTTAKPLAQTKVSEKRQPKPISQLTPSTKLLDSGDGVKNKQTRPPSRSEKDINIKSNHSTPRKAVTDDAIDKGRKRQVSSTSKQPNLGSIPIQSSPLVHSEFSNKPHTKLKLKSDVPPVDSEGCIKKQNNRQASASKKKTSDFSKYNLVLNDTLSQTQVAYTRKTTLKPSTPNAASNITEDDVKRSTKQQHSSVKNSTPDFSSYSSLSDSLVETQASHKRSTKAKSSTPNKGVYASEDGIDNLKTRQAGSNKNRIADSSSNPVQRKSLFQTQIKLIIMNTSGGPNDGQANKSARRRQAIQHVICKRKPDLILFQEFKWKGIQGKTWDISPIPDNYRYTGNLEASMAIDKDKINFQDLPSSGLQSILTELQRTSNNRLGYPFSTDFAPIPRMCIGKVSSMITTKSFECICISWHGRSNGMTDVKKEQDLRYLLEFLRNIKERHRLPLVVGGDFNINIKIAEKTVQSPFQLCQYTPSSRRGGKVIDFYIISEELKVRGDVGFIDLDNDMGLKNINSVLDHDPLVATFLL